MCPNFYLKNTGFDFIDLLLQKSIFINSSIIVLNIMKGHLFTPLLIQGFPTIPGMQQKAPCFERFQRDKNKQKQTNNLI
jgi:hypothetical protein